MSAKSPTPEKTEPAVTAERVRQNLMARVNPIRGLTPESLSTKLENFDLGYLREAALVWQKIRDRDDQVKTVSEKRDLECALLDWEILALDDSPEAAKHKAALEGAYNNLSTTDALDQNKRGGVFTLVKQMMHAIGHKYAVHEIVWNPAGADLTAEFRFTPLQFFENTTGRLRFLPQDYAATGTELEEAGWMITVGPGLMEATSIAYLFKQLPLKDWLIYCEKFGMPGLHGKTDAARESPEWEAFKSALANFGIDWAILTSMNGSITPISAGAQGTQPHPELVDRMDRAIARLWRGADLGTMSKDGSAVGSNPQESETDILCVADAQLITDTLQYYFDRWVIRYRFGNVPPKAYFKLKPKVCIDQKVQLEIDDKLISWGVGRSKQDLLEEYGRPEADEGAELASAPVAASSPFGARTPLANETAARNGRAELFRAAAAADELAARRVVFRPIAVRLAQLTTKLDDSAALLAAVQQFRADAPALYRTVLSQARDLAKPAEEAIGTALVSGFAEAAAAKSAQKTTP